MTERTLPEPELVVGTRLLPFEERHFHSEERAIKLGYREDIRRYYSETQVHKMLDEAMKPIEPAWLAASLNRRADIEKLMFDAARGKRPMPLAEELREWAIRLGTMAPQGPK